MEKSMSLEDSRKIIASITLSVGFVTVYSTTTGS